MSGRLIILPKKQWHVRNQDNIDKVRKDEAEAAAAEEEVERRALLAEKEARIRLMRERASARKAASLIGPQPEGALESGGGGGGEEAAELAGVVHREVTDSSGHINFFQEVEAGEDKVTTNVEHEEEKKKEQEAYEKSVGYLVKLGQDTEETTGEVPWWKRGGSASERLCEPTQSLLKAVNGPLSAIRAKQTDFLDPLNSVRKYLGCEGVRLTMRSHQKVLEEKERKAVEFGEVEEEKIGKKRKRSRSRSRETKKRKRSRSRSGDKKKKSKSKSEKRSRRSRSRDSSHKKRRKEKKRRQRSSSSSSSSDEEDAEKKALAKRNLEKMRRERLERERAERQKADRLVFGECEEDKKKKKEEVKEQKQKYSSQFNPALAKQNKLDPKRKYWLE